MPWRAVLAEAIEGQKWQAVIVESDTGRAHAGSWPLESFAEAVLVVTKADQAGESSSVLQALRDSVAEQSVFLIVLVVDKPTPAQILDAEPMWFESGADAMLIHRGDAVELAMEIQLCVRRLQREQAIRQALAEEVRADIEEEVGERAQAPKENLFWQTAHLIAGGFPKLDASLPTLIEKGTAIGPCVAHKVLGKGAFGQVYLCVDADGFYSEAVKALPKSLVSDLEQFEALQKEASVLMGLSHPNVVRCYGVLHGPDHVFLRLQFAGKRNLVRVMRDYGGCLPVELARDFHQQLADAVAYCHDTGVAHRDIKPENIGVCDAGVTIRLLDFGSSCPVHQVCDAVVGTMPFIAPEVLCLTENVGYLPADMDAWAMGVVLLEMLCGAGALNDRMGWEYRMQPSTEHASALRSIVKASPTMWMDLLHEHIGPVPQALAVLVAGLLELYPAKRWTAAEAASSMWTRTVQKEFVSDNASSSSDNVAATAAVNPVPPSAPRLGSLVRRLRTVVDDANKNVVRTATSERA